jgi:hypothetical protein
VVLEARERERERDSDSNSLGKQDDVDDDFEGIIFLFFFTTIGWKIKLR